jgi:hypothetical protein
VSAQSPGLFYSLIADYLDTPPERFRCG